MEIPGPEKPPPVGELAMAFDRAVGKIAAVWIWTVLFAASTAGTISLYGGMSTLSMQLMAGGMMRGGGMPPGGPQLLGVLLPITALVTILSLGYSWMCQLRFFRGYLIPVVLLGRPVEDGSDRGKRAMRDLAQGYLMLLVSVMCRLIPEALMGLIPLISI